MILLGISLNPQTFSFSKFCPLITIFDSLQIFFYFTFMPWFRCLLLKLSGLTNINDLLRVKSGIHFMLLYVVETKYVLPTVILLVK